MELLPTLQSVAGMLRFGVQPRSRSIKSGEVPDGWAILDSTDHERFASALNLAMKQPECSTDKRFLATRDWGTFPDLLVNATTNRTLPILADSVNSPGPFARLRANMV